MLLAERVGEEEGVENELVRRRRREGFPVRLSNPSSVPWPWVSEPNTNLDRFLSSFVLYSLAVPVISTRITMPCPSPYISRHSLPFFQLLCQFLLSLSLSTPSHQPSHHFGERSSRLRENIRSFFYIWLLVTVGGILGCKLCF